MPNLREHGIAQNLPSRGFGDESFYTFDTSLAVGDTVSYEGENVNHTTDEIVKLHTNYVASSTLPYMHGLTVLDDNRYVYVDWLLNVGQIRLNHIKGAGKWTTVLMTTNTANPIQSCEIFRVSTDVIAVLVTYYSNINIWGTNILLVNVADNPTLITQQLTPAYLGNYMYGCTTFRNGQLDITSRNADKHYRYNITPTSITLVGTTTLSMTNMYTSHSIRSSYVTEDGHLLVLGRHVNQTDMMLQVYKWNATTNVYDLKMNSTFIGWIYGNTTNGLVSTWFITPCETGFVYERTHYNGSYYQSELSTFEYDFVNYTIQNDNGSQVRTIIDGSSGGVPMRLMFTDGIGNLLVHRQGSSYSYSVSMPINSLGVLNEVMDVRQAKYPVASFSQNGTIPYLYKGKLYFLQATTQNSGTNVDIVLYRKDVNMTASLVRASAIGYNRGMNDMIMLNDEIGVVASHNNSTYYIRAFRVMSDGSITWGNEVSIARPATYSSASNALGLIQQYDGTNLYFLSSQRDTTTNYNWLHVCKLRISDLNLTIGNGTNALFAYVWQIISSPINNNKHLLHVSYYSGSTRSNQNQYMYVIDIDFTNLTFTLPVSLTLGAPTSRSYYKFIKHDDYTHLLWFFDNNGTTMTVNALPFFVNSTTLAITNGATVSLWSISTTNYTFGGYRMLDKYTAIVSYAYTGASPYAHQQYILSLMPPNGVQASWTGQQIQLDKEGLTEYMSAYYAVIPDKIATYQYTTYGTNTTRYLMQVFDLDFAKETFASTFSYSGQRSYTYMQQVEGTWVQSKGFYITPQSDGISSSTKSLTCLHVYKPNYTIKKGGKRPIGMVKSINGSKVTVRKFV